MPEEMLGLGFGFVEVGTVTPRPQPGNSKPRLFRLTQDRAVINRLGFNNRGQVAAFERLQRCDRGPIGVNIGANKDSPDWIADYVEWRPGDGAGRPLFGDQYLLAQHTRAARVAGPGRARGIAGGGPRSAAGERSPVFLKVAPDLGDGDAERIVRAALDHGIDALIVGNTTVSRPPLKSRHAGEAGGLSGQPLKSLALETLRQFRKASGGEIPLIGVGGIASADDAWARIRAGASLVQLYTAMVYEGPGIARRIARGLAERLHREGLPALPRRWGASSGLPMRYPVLAFAAAALAVSGCAATSANQPTPQTGMVSAADPRAAAAGVEMLRRGGSAADAAIATLLALNVVEPQSSGIGGGGFMVYSDRGGAPVTYDGRETAPAAAGPSWFLKDGQPMSFDEAVPGGKSVGVPGNVRLMAMVARQAWQVAVGGVVRARDPPCPRRVRGNSAAQFRARPRR